eukprot:TRINITY_DN4293_c0_g1_i1.p1 TRINITY_DN4293_c0_g1~~TRINITY_DN4293_c0_g1_i1.p1  ORF type:complete len:572 (-),score=111.03 TRINITY_DN4293_c0_g1_i1:92-1807(-)
MVVTSDLAILKMILRQLLLNAVQHTTRGMVHLAAASETLLLPRDGASGEAVLKFTVADSGGGFDESLLPVFREPFSSHRPVGAGSSLGLALCYQLIGLFPQGSLEFSSGRSGTTATVTVAMPYVSAPETKLPSYEINVSVISESARLTSSIATDLAVLTSLPPVPGYSSIESFNKVGRLGISSTATPSVVLLDIAASSSLSTLNDAATEKQQACIEIVSHLPNAFVVLVGYPRQRPIWIDEMREVSYLNKPVRARSLVKALNRVVSPGPLPSLSASKPKEMSTLRVLIAEDNVLMRKIFTHMLDNMGVTYVDVPNGREAVEAYRTEGPFHVCLLDFLMPGINGLVASEKIRAIEKEKKTPPVPIYILSAVGVEGMDLIKDKGYSSYKSLISGWLSKPISKPALEALLEKNLPREKLLSRSLSSSDLVGDVEETPPPPPPYSVLLVEDNDVIGNITIRVLSSGGADRCDVTRVSSGREALETLDDLYSAFDLILMDYDMPVMDGLSCVSQIRALEDSQGLSPKPVILMAAEAAMIRQRSLNAGCNDIIPKPIDFPELRMMLSRIREKNSVSE